MLNFATMLRMGKIGTCT